MDTLEKVYLLNHLERLLSLYRRQKCDEKKNPQNVVQLVRIQNVPIKTGHTTQHNHRKSNSSDEDVVVVLNKITKWRSWHVPYFKFHLLTEEMKLSPRRFQTIFVLTVKQRLVLGDTDNELVSHRC